MKIAARFRVTLRHSDGKTGNPEQESFHFSTFREAKRHYKSTVLALYKQRDWNAWEICLNRCQDVMWENPIFRESHPGKMEEGGWNM